MSSELNERARLAQRIASGKPPFMGTARNTLLAKAKAARGALESSLDAGHRGEAERLKQLDFLLDYHEYLTAADVLADYPERTR